MGHYDSCRDETWSVKDTRCSGKNLSKEKLKKFKGDHDWKNITYGIQQCINCDHTIYYT